MRAGLDDTIVAIATPLAEAGLGVVRLSGPDAITIAARLLQSRSPLTAAASHTVQHGWLVRNGLRLDEVVAAVFRAPASYTGEDVVEFSCHGSPAVLRELLTWCSHEGARLARPGEFTERAYTHGKIDLAQAESVASLIGARSVRAAEAAAVQLKGGLSQHVGKIRRDLIDFLADLEANLDFAEEANPNMSHDRLLSVARGLEKRLSNLLATSVQGRALRDGCAVVLAGRPNAGKSSLFNAFLAQERAIVTDVPGTTRDTLDERLDWNGYPITLVDTAGLRPTADAIEILGTERARRAHERADVVVLVIDASLPLSDDDRDIARGLSGKAVVVALNKIDRGVALDTHDVAAFGGKQVSISAVTGAGLPELKSAILSLVPGAGDTSESGLVVTNERQAERLREAASACAAAVSAIEKKRSEEAVAVDLRRAAGALAAITGEDVGEAVLDSIFRRFCIGK